MITRAWLKGRGGSVDTILSEVLLATILLMIMIMIMIKRSCAFDPL